MIMEKISKRLCNFERNTLLSAKENIQISEDDSVLIKLCKKSLRFSKGDAWKKNSSDSIFDITIWNYDDVEIFELVGHCILSQLNTFIEQKDVGLCRDDLEALNAQHQTDRIRKHIEKFKYFFVLK